MRKINKILVLLMVIMMAFVFSVKVNAATTDEYGGYKEITEENKTPEETDEKTPDTTQTPTETKTTNTPNKATQPAPQAGEFTATIIGTSVVLVSVLTIVGYKKFKKYNY